MKSRMVFGLKRLRDQEYLRLPQYKALFKIIHRQFIFRRQKYKFREINLDGNSLKLIF